MSFIAEILICALAAIVAGIGTGLAGLSAATVMVPVMVVLCPSFAGEAGAYQATAIALASDILGSAVTTGTYIKHGNIDLKRGKVMLICIVAMCTVGSYVAWLAGRQVLSGFTLFLTFCIGIRFLVKPDSSGSSALKKFKIPDLAVSLFFGLAIGFGTGFVGTGGGMMMLVVFTMFLGMELKTAVGTSTFIMTFTALIASVSHILINPAIVTDRLVILIVCVVAETAASLISARFANKAPAKTVGLVTGCVLTILGAAMIFFNYRETILSWDWIYDVLPAFGKYLIFIVPFACVLLLIHKIFNVPRYIFRKLLHIAAIMSAPVIVYTSAFWQSATAVFLLFAIVVYPVLAFFERFSFYSKLFVQKRPGEIKLSLVLLFGMAGLLCALTWGAFGMRYLLPAAVMIWGYGDAAAAIVGITFGKHKINWILADKGKSFEGTVACFVFGFVAGVVIMLLATDKSVAYILVVCFVAAAASALGELMSRKGYDTVVCPTVAIAVLSLFEFLTNF